jgi:hypothetical protein
MLDFHSAAGVLAALVAAPAYYFYPRSIKRGKTVPNIATWIIWWVVGTIICISYIVTGARASAVATAVYAAGPPVVIWYMRKYGEIEFGLKEIVCLVICVFSLILWGVYRNSMIALYINIVLDAGAVVPTIIDTWSKPEEEDRTTWTFSTCSTIVNLFAVELWIHPKLWLNPETWWTKEFAVCIYPVVLVLMCSSVLLLILTRPKSTIQPA